MIWVALIYIIGYWCSYRDSDCFCLSACRRVILDVLVSGHTVEQESEGTICAGDSLCLPIYYSFVFDSLLTTYLRTRIHMHVFMCLCTCICVRIHTYIHGHKETCIYRYMLLPHMYVCEIVYFPAFFQRPLCRTASADLLLRARSP